jgi:hypothetical protein
MVSEVSVHGQPASLFLDCGEAEHHGGKAWRSKVAHLLLVRKQREKLRGRGKA